MTNKDFDIHNSAIEITHCNLSRFKNDLLHYKGILKSQKRLKLKHRAIDTQENIKGLEHTIKVWTFILNTVRNRVSELDSNSKLSVAE